MKKYSKMYLTFILVFSLVFTFNSGTFASNNDTLTSVSGTFADVSTVRSEKIGSSLWEYMQTADDEELIPIGIDLIPIDDASLMEKVKTKTGMDPEIYRNEERFQKEVVSKITTVLENKLGYEEAHRVGNNDALTANSLSEETAKTIRSAFSEELKDISVDAEKIIEFSQADSSLSVVDYTVLQLRKNYQAEKNKVLKEEQSAANDLFISNYVAERNNEVTYASRYISSLYLKSRKSDIIYYAQQAEVVSINYCDTEIEAEPMLNIIPRQVGADSVIGTKSSGYNNGNGYKGAGITIGIIETGGVCDTTSPHYDSSRIHIIPNEGAELVSSTHASLVTAIAAGSSVSSEHYEYTGIAPKAEVFITRSGSYDRFVSGLETLADNGVDVINISLGYGYTSYSYVDKYLDEFINSTDIQCVVSAGNNGNSNGNVTSPGFALNCITVGNLNTKSSGTVELESPYELRSTSSWQEPDSIPNKPDICAPGTWVRAVRIPYLIHNFYYDLERLDDSNITPSGTSFAAPVVTGIIAQMLQAESSRIGRPQAIKAKIINSADPTKVSTTNNVSSPSIYVRERSGAGMVNSVNAVNWHSYKHAWNHQAVESEYVTRSTIELTAGEKIRATLAFNTKNYCESIDSTNKYYNMDLRVIDEDGNVLRSSTSTRNNVEIIEYTATANRTVYIQTRIKRNLTDSKIDWALEVDKY